MKINGSIDTAGELGRHAVGRIKHMNPASTQIGEKILAEIGGRELKHGRVIESAANDGAADIVLVEVDRASERWVVGRSFRYRPAIVWTSNTVVDFLIGRLADIVDEHAARARLKGEGKRIAEPKCPDRPIVPSRAIIERIIRWDATVGVNAQYFPEQVGKSLCVCAVRVLAHADIKLSVRPEMESASIVIGGAAKVVEIQ